MHEIRRQENWVTIVEQHGYTTAEQVDKLVLAGSLEDGMAKALAEVLKMNQSSRSPRLNTPRFLAPAPTFPQNFQYPQPQQPQSQQLFPQQPQSQPQQFLAQQTQGWGTISTNPAPGFLPTPRQMLLRPPYPGAKKARFGPPDKSGSLCFSCNQVGHWSGDPACPMTPHSQPPPPGTGSGSN